MVGCEMCSCYCALYGARGTGIGMPASNQNVVESKFLLVDEMQIWIKGQSHNRNLSHHV